MKALIGLVALLVIIAGCAQQATMEQKEEMREGEWTPEETAAMEEAEKKEAMMEQEWTSEEIAAMEQEHEATMTGAYRDWDKAAFDKAAGEGKIILIDFAANWCPACQAEHPQLIAGLENLNDPRFVGFRVHYKDDETTPEHTELAKKYGIAYQHTKVVIKDGKMVLKSPAAWTADKVVTELKRIG